MLGYNQITGVYKDLPEDTLKVTSTFITLQGEGPFCGTPAIFLRLTGCNLNCSFCDTYFDEGKLKNYSQVEEEIDLCIMEFNAKHQTSLVHKDLLLVVTGGEPCLQGDNLWKFVESDYAYKFSNVQLETNGMYAIPENVDIEVVCSPKCNSKGTYITPHKSILDRENFTYFKFVVSSDETSPYHNIPQWAIERRKQNLVFVSPMNMYKQEPREHKIHMFLTKEEIDEKVSFWDENLLDWEQNQRNHEYAGLYALKHGLTLNIQQHLYVSLA